MLYNQNDMKKIIMKMSLLSIVLCPPIFIGANSVNYISTKKITEHKDPEDTKSVPWDMFGDWSIPERYADHNNMLYEGNMDDVDEKPEYRLEPFKAEFDINKTYFYEPDNWSDKDLKNSLHKRKYTHEKYENYEDVDFKNGGEFLNEEGNYENPTLKHGDNLWHKPKDLFNVVERTPVRGIVSFWEWTNDFNSYVLSETNNGTKESDNLYYEDTYASYISKYVSSSSSKYPNIYSYLEDTSKIWEIFKSHENQYNDDQEWILSSDYKLTKDSLPNAFVSLEDSWSIYSFVNYVSDFVVWNWNVNVYPTLDSSIYKKIDPGDIEINYWNKEGLDYANEPFRSLNTTEEAKASFLTKEDPLVVTINWVKKDDQSITDFGHQMVFTFGGMDDQREERSPLYYPNHWREKGAYNGVTAMEYSMFDPFTGQLNLNAYNPTLIDNNTINQGDLDSSFINEESLASDATFSIFKDDFEYWLVNNPDGINSKFIDTMSNNDYNYYSNLSLDGTKFLNRNRFQTGLYPAEDIRLNDLNITYTDSTGAIIDENTSLSDIDEINISISIDETSPTAFLFDYSYSNILTVDPSTIITPDIPVTPPDTGEEGGVNTAVIIGAVIATVTIAGAAIAVIAIKRRR